MKTLLIKPFDKYQERHLIIVGSIATIIGVGITFLLGGRFDGALDFHLGSNVTVQQAISDTAINIFCLVMLLYIAAKYLNTKTRLVDIISTVIIARIPLYFIALFSIGGKVQAASSDLLQGLTSENIQNFQDTIPKESLVVIMLFALVTLIFVIWSIALMYNGYKTASNAKGKKAIVLFIVALLGAELISKLFISYI